MTEVRLTDALNKRSQTVCSEDKTAKWTIFNFQFELEWLAQVTTDVEQMPGKKWAEIKLIQYSSCETSSSMYPSQK